MNVNSSLDFLDMIKSSADKQKGKNIAESARKTADQESTAALQKDAMIAENLIAVIDTETNWHDEVMSVGVALADEKSFGCLERFYYIFDRECRVGGMYSYVLNRTNVRGKTCSRKDAITGLRNALSDRGVKKIFAYNAKFDLGHLPELADFEWFDIMRIAAYRQFNPYIPDTAQCCKTGRLKSNYGVEPITHMITSDTSYRETHNAVNDACDELRIMELLGLPIDKYECGRIN